MASARTGLSSKELLVTDHNRTSRIEMNERKPRVDFAGAVRQAEELGKTEIKMGEGMVQHVYADYETYRRVQEEGNKAKLNAQFVKKSHIFFLADWLAGSGRTVDFGLCHGVRRGKEQGWFRRRLRGAEIIGTDISETATEFPNTVQWDFHDDNPDWAGRADFVYSNSWDHAFDPTKAFRAWVKCLKPGGVLLLDHTAGHMPRASNALDPFGATEPVLITLLNEACAGYGSVTEVLDRRDAPEYRCRVVVLRRDPA
ncbi:MAG: methyltransferase domain-containing protein [Rhodobacteraceae bacterium]|nr:methyltransferase domain-containing protein [Paracoccaceae bacterium]